MANFKKHKAHEIGHLLTHNNRSAGDHHHSNEDIDDSRTPMNYYFKHGSVEDLKKRLSQVFVMKRKDMTVLGSMVVTLPKDVKDGDERAFFKACYDFYRNDVGQENVINAVVHKDEKTPHLHFDFVPVVKGNIDFDNKFGVRGRKALEEWIETHQDRELERLCCYEKITQEYLDNMHSRLSEYVKNELGYEVTILNGATSKGNKNKLQMQTENLQEQIEKLQEKRDALEHDMKLIETMGRKYSISQADRGIKPLMERIVDLETQNRLLRAILSKNEYKYSKEELAALRDRKYTPAKSVAVNVFEGSYINTDIEKNAVIVVELYDQVQRKSPQQKLIDENDDLYRQAKLVQGSNIKVMWRNSRTTDRLYLFIKTDNAKETMENLMLMEQRLKDFDLRGRKFYMDRMETDEYDLAKTILQKNDITAHYYVRYQQEEKEDSKEATIEKQ